MKMIKLKKKKLDQQQKKHYGFTIVIHNT
jgi:hypothetical protein